VTYLHGRYVNYQLINSKEDIDSLLNEANASDDEQKSLRFKALRSSVTAAAKSGGLLVVGYDGWEDAILKIVETELFNEGRFEPGIIWCLYGDRSQLRPNVRRLAERHPRFKIVENISAIEVMRALLEAAGISEAEVIQTIQHSTTSKNEDLRRRWIQIHHSSKGWPKDEQVISSEPAEVSLERVKHDCEQAFLDPRYSALSFALLDAALQNAAVLSREEVAVVLQYRGELSLRYSAEISRAIADFHAVIGLSKGERGRALIGLAEAYRRVGKQKSSRYALHQAYRLAKKSKAPLLIARCRLLHAYQKYDVNKLDRAHRIVSLAALAFEEHGRFDLSSLSYALQAGMCSFNNDGNAGLGFAERALSSANKGGSRFGEARAKHARGFCFLSLGDLPSAATALMEARKLALEGPDYVLLSEINVLLADELFSRKDVQGAVSLLEEAVEIARLLSNGRALSQALVWRDIYKLHLKSRPTQEEVAAAFTSISQYEQLGDLAVSATHWSVLTYDLLSFENHQELHDKIKHALHNCKDKAREFSSTDNDSDSDNFERTTDDGTERRSLDAQLTAHVEEHATAANLLYGLTFLGPSFTPTERRKLLATYRDFQRNFEIYGFASPRTEVVMAIVSSLFKKYGILADGELVKYRNDLGSAQFENENVKEFCVRKGFWRYALLVG
jgi:Flp pilus assembly protein TadD